MQVLSDPESYMPGKAQLAEIQARIDGYNAARPAIYSNCFRDTVIALTIYAGFAVLAVMYVSELGIRNKDYFWVFGLIAIGAIGIFTLMWRPMERHQRKLRDDLFPKLFGFVEGVTYQNSGNVGFLQHISDLKLVSYDTADNDDLIAGRHDGLDFELLETTLTRGTGRNEETVFKGLILHFRLDREFPGMLVAAKRGGWWQRTMKEFWRTGSQNELKSGNLRLDESHQFYSDNFAAARPVIAGPLTSVLTWLGNEWHGGDVRIALSGEDGYLLLPSDHNYFSLPRDSEHVVYERHVKPLVRELLLALAMAHVVRHLS